MYPYMLSIYIYINIDIEILAKLYIFLTASFRPLSGEQPHLPDVNNQGSHKLI